MIKIWANHKDKQTNKNITVIILSVFLDKKNLKELRLCILD